jgi:hypothetical protein
MKKLWINYLINNLVKMRPSIVLTVIKHQAIFKALKTLSLVKILLIKIKQNHQLFRYNNWKISQN